MTDSAEHHRTLQLCEGVFHRLELRQIGYIVRVETQRDAVLIVVDHPLRGDVGWTVGPLRFEEGWDVRLEETLRTMLDLDIARAALSAVRAESVPLLGLLRHQILVECAHHANSPQLADAAVGAITRVAMAYRSRFDALNDDEVGWLLEASESELETLAFSEEGT